VKVKDELADELAKFLDAKASYQAGKLDYRAYRDTKRAFHDYRFDLRVLSGRPWTPVNDEQKAYHEARWAKAGK